MPQDKNSRGNLAKQITKRMKFKTRKNSYQ